MLRLDAVFSGWFGELRLNENARHADLFFTIRSLSGYIPILVHLEPDRFGERLHVVLREIECPRAIYSMIEIVRDLVFGIEPKNRSGYYRLAV